MKNKILIVLALILVPLIYLRMLWNSLPASLPVHFNFKGEIDKCGSKEDVLIITIALSFTALVVYVLFSNIHRLNPKIASADNKERMKKFGLAIVAFMMVIQCWLLYIIKQGQVVFSIKFVLIAISLLFAIIGNYMPNLKPNYVAGFRLPWTLHDQTNWKKTHDVAGRLWFGGGVLAALLCVVLPFKIALIAMAIIFAVFLALPAIYSYRLHKKTKLL